jgi:hypothetical protein
VSKLKEAFSNGEVQLDDVEYNLREIIDGLGIKVPSAEKIASRGLKPLRLTKRERDLKRKAEKGINSMKLVPLAGGAALVHLEGGVGVRLTASLARLLKVLTADAGSSLDHLVPWKPRAFILAQLKSCTGEEFTRRALIQLIHRLHGELKKHEENYFCVLASRKHGYRFALRRGVTTVTSDIHH